MKNNVQLAKIKNNVKLIYTTDWVPVLKQIIGQTAYYISEDVYDKREAKVTKLLAEIWTSWFGSCLFTAEASSSWKLQLQNSVDAPDLEAS